MSGFGEAQRRILRSVIEVAREVLRRFDDSEVPPKVRRVAAYTGGSLPAPLASALLAEIDRNEWLREKVAETWRERGEADLVAAAFLERPPGWWLELAAAAEAERSAETVADAERAGSEIADLERRLRASREKQRVLADRAADAEAELRNRDAADTAPLRAALERAQRQLDDAGQRVAHLEAEVAALERERESVRRQLTDARTEQRGLREERAALLRRLDTRHDEAPASTPGAIAAELDRSAARLRPFREFAPTPAAPDRGSELPALPPGIAPDSAAAIEALIAAPGPLTVLIDGHNLLGVSDAASLADAGARHRLVNRLGRLRTALGGHRVVVVFDSSLDEGRGTYRSDRGVEIVFGVGEATADDEIVRLAGSVTGPVVVSDDREVRERSSRVGALGLWARAVIDWLS